MEQLFDQLKINSLRKNKWNKYNNKNLNNRELKE